MPVHPKNTDTHIINPFTGRLIERYGKSYKTLMAAGKLTDAHLAMPSTTPLPAPVVEQEDTTIDYSSKKIQKLIEDNIDLFDESMSSTKIDTIVRSLLKKTVIKQSQAKLKRKYFIKDPEPESDSDDEESDTSE